MKRTLFFLVAALALSGCATVPHIQTTPSTAANPTPSPTASLPAFSIPPAPALVDIHPAVAEADFQAAQSRIATSEPSSSNVGDFLTVAQYQFNQNDLDSSLKTYKRVLSAQNRMNQMDKAQYMLGQVYYAQKSF